MLKTLLVASLAAHGAAILLNAARRYRTGTLCFTLGSLGALIHIAAEWITTGQPPFGSMYHVMVLLGACALPGYGIVVVVRHQRQAARFFPVGAAVPILAAILMEHDATWHLAPALQSPWFVPHVMAYMLSYALCFVAFILLVVTTLKNGDGAVAMRNTSHGLLSAAFPFMTFGLLSGALWANSIWGRYWSWDPKETWSLITWTLYLVYFHCRKSRLSRYARTAHVLAFCALVTTFLLVNLLPKLASKLHSYV